MWYTHGKLTRVVYEPQAISEQSHMHVQDSLQERHGPGRGCAENCSPRTSCAPTPAARRRPRASCVHVHAVGKKKKEEKRKEKKKKKKRTRPRSPALPGRYEYCM